MRIQTNSKFKLNNALISFFQNSSNIAALALLITSYFIFFWKLGEGGIRQWDESSLAVNALEMALNGNPLVKYMGGEIDLINTKPPLAIWFIIGCMKIFGYTEFALRLPSAVCALATVFIIYIFCRYYLNDSLAAFLSGLVLITSIGFTGEHVARTGDYDAVLVLWIIIYSLSYFIFLETKEKRKKKIFLTITTVALVLAVWTKGIAGLLVLPSLFIYTIYKKKVKDLFLSPSTYICAIAFIALSLSYYFLREFYSSGFLKAVLENELTGRYMDVVPGGTQRGFLYYLRGMLSYRFRPWIYLLPLCWIATFAKQVKIIRNFSVFGLIYFFSYFFIISYSKTKFHWYDAPLYPIASLMVGLNLATLIGAFIIFLRKKFFKQVPLFQDKIVYCLIIGSLFFLPYLKNLHEVYQDIPFRENNKSITDVSLLYRDYFKELRNFSSEIRPSKSIVINTVEYNLPLLYYVQAAEVNKTHSLTLEWKKTTNLAFEDGDVIINCNSAISKDLGKQYITQLLHRAGSCETLEIQTRRSRT